MTPDRLSECLSIIRWTPDTLARALKCDVSLVEAWLGDTEEIPPKAGAWLEALAITHAATEALKPAGLKGRRAKA
ncbi:hypothetical protein [Arvimicrobium flavum]|uniref:hypothetical protein n=1 Tax=Arvimicrobium flavum TaxID=3393320 RepID=UPI00237B25EE|nr:hypothetical protein [Mesorhizobium shangrilense]